VRAASVKYSNSNELNTLAEKLAYLFKNHLIPFAGKSKAKNAEDDVSYITEISHIFIEKLQDCTTSL
jgi:hypothetical protein